MPHSSLATGLESMSTDVPLPFCHVTDFLTVFFLSSIHPRKIFLGQECCSVQTEVELTLPWIPFFCKRKRSSPGQAETSNCILNKGSFQHHGQIQGAGKDQVLPQALPGRGSCSKSCGYIPIRGRYNNRVTSRSSQLNEDLGLVILPGEYFLAIKLSGAEWKEGGEDSLSSTFNYLFSPFGTLLSELEGGGWCICLIIVVVFKVKSKLGLAVGLKQNLKQGEKGSERSTVLEKLCVWGGCFILVKPEQFLNADFTFIFSTKRQLCLNRTDKGELWQPKIKSETLGNTWLA